MKRNIYYWLFCALMACASCSKDITEANANYPAINPSRPDANAGSWKPIMLSSTAEFPCAVPIPTASPDYVLQINEIKSYQANITKADEDLVRYWGAGAVLRWNEIMRELVAKHNLPPVPVTAPDGTTVLPNPANPLASPTFPFSSPPYAARAYAYLSAAQYDAVISAYYYKQQFNRNAPFRVDNTLKTLLPQSTLPSYPSEDAAIWGASVEILKLMFPGDQDYINQRALEHRRARLLSGANVRSDLEAGEALGKLVAAKFVGRARTDRASQAIGTPAFLQQLTQTTIARGEMPWISREVPERAPLLPLFGRVRAFLFDSATLVNAIRPPAPPSTQSSLRRAELEETYQLSKNITRDQLRLINYWANASSTYTPAGQWNHIAANDFVTLNFSEARWARNMALLNIAIMDACIACWDTKYTYFTPRPSQQDSRIKANVSTPNIPPYISGHSTFAAAATTVLSYIVPARAAAFKAMVTEVSLSRMQAGLQHRSDCVQGEIVGSKVGALAVAKGRADGAE
jgi:PAP2 superfamily